MEINVPIPDSYNVILSPWPTRGSPATTTRRYMATVIFAITYLKDANITRCIERMQRFSAWAR